MSIAIMGDHLARFRQAMRICRLDCRFSAAQLEDAVLQLLQANEVKEDTCLAGFILPEKGALPHAQAASAAAERPLLAQGASASCLKRNERRGGTVRDRQARKPAEPAERLHCRLSDMIGETPVCRLNWMPGERAAAVFLKLEHFNPGGSIKDRTALGMMRAAEEAGRLRPGMRIVESSSGNTAIGLAMLAREGGYRVTTICDRHLPLNKRARLESFGAEIVFLPETPLGADTVELRIAVANRLAERLPDAVALGQYFNPANPDIHYRTTGPEIWRQMDGRLDAVVIAVGTCGTISGVGRYLKEMDPGIEIIGVEPAGSVIFGGEDGRYLIQGGGLSFVPPILDRSVIDRGLKVADRDAVRAIHRLAAAEGIMVGGTGGLVVHTLIELARTWGPGHNLVGIIPDAGDRYLDTIFDAAWLDRHGLVPERTGNGEGGRAGDDIDSELGALGCSLNAFSAASNRSLQQLCAELDVRMPVGVH